MACKHDGGNIQQFTEVCLDCGVNIYETDSERIQRLRREISYLQREADKVEADSLEAKRDRLREKLNPPSDNNSGGW